MYKKIFFLLLSCSVLFNCTISTYCAFEFINTGARPFSLGNAYIAISDDIYSTNPAGYATLESIELCANYNSLYGIEDIGNNYFAVALPYGYNAFGAGVHKTEIVKEYYETMYMLFYSRKILQGTSIGLQVNFYNLAAPGYESKNDLYYRGKQIFSGYNFGLLQKISNNFKFGVVINNLNSPQFKLLNSSLQKEKLNSEFITAVAYEFRKIIFSVEYQPSEVRLGSEVSIADTLLLRLGSNKNNFTAGLGLNFNLSKLFAMQLDFAVAAHNRLGLSYQLSTIFRWRK